MAASLGSPPVGATPDLRHNGVMKFPGEAAARIARSLLDVGPATASDLADRLGLTATAIRRPLSALLDADFVVASDRAPYGPAPAPRRGRPSQVFSLTAAGRSAFNEASDDLALELLRFVDRTQGRSGVEAFATERAGRLVQRIGAPGGSPSAASIQAMAQTLSDAGYAATVDVAGDDARTVQLCQHSCPVAEAAAEFPALCEAETAALGEALGVHVTRLATIAHGDGVCTTVIPIDARRSAGAASRSNGIPQSHTNRKALA
ncbi:MAG: ArsR family transcriptional regulator [Actinobacteria bacterium]|nr:ArsR family transcriptional regulator [Actinomycetota bacterium]